MKQDIQIHLENVSYAYAGGVKEGGETSTDPATDATPAPAPASPALRGITLDIRAGEHVCILGGNGSGKSTLVQLMNALLTPTAGTVRVFGMDTADPASTLKIRQQVAMVFQHPDDQLVASVVADDVAFGPENLGVPQPKIAPRVDAALRAVDMEGLAQTDPTALSGGQQQRVAIAGALAMQPRVLILDEPSAMLDEQGRRAVQGIIEELNARGTTIVHVTHFMDDALRARRVIVLDGGRVAADGTPNEVFARRGLVHELGLELPFTLQVEEDLEPLGFALPQTTDEDELADALAEELVEREDGEDAKREAVAGEDRTGDKAEAAAATIAPQPAAAPRPAATPSPTPAIAFDDVSFSYVDAASARKRQRKRRRTRARNRRADEPLIPDPLALEHASFSVPEGSLTALVGCTGSGKSTTVELACALKLPRSGCVTVCGIDTADLSHRRELRQLVGYVSQLPERQLFAETVYEDVAFGPRNMGLDEDEVERRVCEAVAEVGLPVNDELLNRSPFELSGGQQRSVAIAGVLAMRQRVLVLDEPMVGLDPRGRAAMRALLRGLKSQGVTLLLVTHSMDDVAELADSVVVLKDSHVAAIGAPSEIFGRADQPVPERAATLGEPHALALARMLEARGARLTRTPLTRRELVEEVAAHGDSHR